MLVVIGVNERGEKQFLAIEDGVRKSTHSWREVLVKLKARGLTQAPTLAVGDGALDEVYPETRPQRFGVHKTANVLNYLPKSVQPKVQQALQKIRMAPTRSVSCRIFDLLVEMDQAKYPKATECLKKDRETLLAFYDFPVEHWPPIRTSNPIESSFATIRHRTHQMLECASRETLLTMMFKLGQCAEGRWRRIRGFPYLAKVITGVRFTDGIEKIDHSLKNSRSAT